MSAMRRTHEEFKAEILRRSEEARRDRHRKTVRTVLCCVPLAVCVAVSAFLLPYVWPQTTPSMESEDEGDRESVPESATLSNVVVAVPEGEEYTLFGDTAARIESNVNAAWSSNALADDVTKENQPVSAGCPSWTEPPLYDITVTVSGGITVSCKIFEDNAYYFDDGALSGVCGWFEIPAEYAAAIRSLLEQEVQP